VAAACDVLGKPLANYSLIEMNKNALTEFLDRRATNCVLRKRSTAHRELNVLKFAVSAGRGSLKPCETVEAGNFA
jgi:hypothetical protein